MKTRIASFFLAFLMLVTVLPAELFAAIAEEFTTFSTQSGSTGTTGEGEPEAKKAVHHELSYVGWGESTKIALEEGSGTESDPYKIYSPEALEAFAKEVNENKNTEIYGQLCVNIDYEDHEWTPIGSKDAPFKGGFDGQNHEVRNYSIDQGWNRDLSEVKDRHVGFFGFVKNAEISNLGVASYRIDYYYNSDTAIGGLVGYAEGQTTITNCYADGDISACFVEQMPFERTDTVDVIEEEKEIPSEISYKNKYGQGVILDLRKVNKAINKTVTVSGDVNALRIVGDPNVTYSGLQIRVPSSTTFFLELENVHLNDSSFSMYSSIEGELYINCLGASNSIASTSGIPLFVEQFNVTIMGEADLTVYGGNGADGADGSDYTLKGGSSTNPEKAGNGANGSNGKPAMICSSLIVRSDGGYLSFYGGNGGDGGDGGDVLGEENCDGRPKLTSGGNGGAGGAGADAIGFVNKSEDEFGKNPYEDFPYLYYNINVVPSVWPNYYYYGYECVDDYITVYGCGSFYMQPGNGGDGGNGGKGGDVYESKNMKPDDGGDGGNGGSGGNGFIPGNGGHGGAGGYSYGRNVTWPGSNEYGTSGDGGNGGNTGVHYLAYNGHFFYKSNVVVEIGIGGACGRTDTDSYSAYRGEPGDDGKTSTRSYPVSVINGSFVPGSNEVVLFDYLVPELSVPLTISVGGLAGYAGNSVTIECCSSVISFYSQFGGCTIDSGYEHNTLYMGVLVGDLQGSVKNAVCAQRDSAGSLTKYQDHALWLGKGTLIEGADLGVSVFAITETITENGSKYYSCQDSTGLIYDSDVTSENTGAVLRTVYRYVGSASDVIVPAYICNGKFIGEVDRIEQCAFKNCTGLVSVDLGSCVSTVGESVFFGCTDLEDITIGKELEEIFEYTDNGDFKFLFGLEKKLDSTSVKYTVDGENKTFASDEYGVLYEVFTASNGEQYKIVVIDAPKELGSGYSMPAHVVEIKPYAFAYNEGLQSVDLFYVMNVDDHAFYQASALKSVKLSQGEESDTYVQILDKEYPGGIDKVSKIIEDYAFTGCTNLTTADLYNSNIVEIGERAFADCGNLKTMLLGAEVGEIGDQAWGTNGGAGTQLGWYEAHEDNKKYLSMDGVLYRWDEKENEKGEKERVLSLMSYPAQKRESIDGSDLTKNFTVPEQVAKIDAGAFKDSLYLKTVNVGSGVEEIGGSAFSNCVIETATFGKNVKTIGNRLFSGSGYLREIYVDGENEVFSSKNGVLFKKKADETLELCQYPPAKVESSYTVPQTVTSISSYAFENSGNLKEVVIASELSYVGSYAFTGCHKLSVIYFRDTAAPKTVETEAFYTYDLTLDQSRSPRTTIYYSDEYESAWTSFIDNYGCTTCPNCEKENYHFASYSNYTPEELIKQSNYYLVKVLDQAGEPINNVYVSLTDQNGVELSKSTANGVVTMLDQYDKYGVGFDIHFDASYQLRVIDNRGEYFPIENTEFYMDEETRMTYITLSLVPHVSGVSVSYALSEEGLNKIENAFSGGGVFIGGRRVSYVADINSETAEINKWCVSSMNILVECGYDLSATLLNCCILQENTVLESGIVVETRELGGKKYSVLSFGVSTEKLLPEKDLYVVADIETGGQTNRVQTKLNIRVIELSLKKLNFSFLENGQSLKIAPELSAILKAFDKELPIFKEMNLSFAVEVHPGSFKIAISNAFSESDKFFEGEFDWGAFKDKVEFKNPLVEDSPVTTEITGFIEIKYKGLTEEGETDFEVISGVTGVIAFEEAFADDTVIFSIPISLEVKVDASGELTFQVTVDREAESLIVPAFQLKLTGELTLSAGVGCKVCSVGVYGSAKMMFLFDIEPEILGNKWELNKWTMSGDVGLYFKYDGLFLKWKRTWSLLEALDIDTEWVIYEDGKWFYEEEQTGELVYFDAPSLNQVIYDETNYVIAESTLLENSTTEGAYALLAPQMVQIDGKIYIVYHDDLNGQQDANGTVYDEYNYQKLVYQIYDIESATLSKVHILDNNGYADGAFDLYVDEEQVVVLYSQWNKRLTSDDMEDIEGYLSAIEVKTAVLDGGSLVPSQAPLTSNAYYEMNLRLGTLDGDTVAVWVENRENSLLGTTQNNNTNILISIFEDGIWSDPMILKSSLGTITDLEICEQGIAYITDSNNNLMTVGSSSAESLQMEGYDDRIITVLDRLGNVKSQTEQGAYHDLSVINEAFVYYCQKKLYSLKDAAAILPEGTSVPTEEYTVLTDSKGNEKAILFVVNASVASSGSDQSSQSDLYGIFYSQESEQWGAAVKLTDLHPNTYVTAYDAVDQGDKMVLSVLISEDLDEEVQMHSFETISLPYPEAITLGKVSVKETYRLVNGENGVLLYAKITNNGYLPLHSIHVSVAQNSADSVNLVDQDVFGFYDEEGTLLKDGLASGMTGYVKVSFLCAEVGNENYTVTIGGVSANLSLWHSDFAVQGKLIKKGEQYYILAYFQNKGALLGEYSWNMQYGGMDLLSDEIKEQLGAKTVKLACGEYLYLEIPINVTALNQKTGLIRLYVDTESSETAVANNEALISISLSEADYDILSPMEVLSSIAVRFDRRALQNFNMLFDSSYELTSVMVDGKSYSAESGLYRVQDGMLVWDASVISKNIVRNGIYSVKYFLTKDGVVYTKESTLELLGLRGDIDWDDKVTIGDVTALLTILSGKGIYPAQDLDDSEGITIGDVTALLSMLSGR